MDVRVEARPLTAAAVVVETQVNITSVADVIICSPVVSRFTLAPVISIAGHSISAINPEFIGGREKAIA